MKRRCCGAAFEALDEVPELAEVLERAIDPEAPVSVRDGGVIRAGYSAELDELREIAVNGKAYLSALEQKEREATGIKNLRIGYNRVFGYYIEVAQLALRIRCPIATRASRRWRTAERYITEELKELENKILGAQESALRLEYSLFCDIRGQMKDMLPRLQITAQAMKTLDALLSLSRVASLYNYARPAINDEGRYEIVNGRHPVVEDSIGRENFVPNDTQSERRSPRNDYHRPQHGR